MTKTQIKEIQKKVGAAVDGFWGPESSWRTKEYLRDLMPDPHPFPTYKEIRTGKTEFGEPCWPGEGTYKTRKIALPFTMYLYGDRSRTVRSVSANVACADELEEALALVRDVYPSKEEQWAAGVSKYYGVRACRAVRGGSIPSNHAWASAIDLDAPRNGNRTHWPTQAKMPFEVMECFAKVGFQPAGAFWNRDAMHFEATRPG